MSTGVDSLKERLRRWVLIVGMAQVLFGCLVGFIPPTAVPWFRGIVMAHIEFTANGVLMVVVGLLTREMRLGAGALKVWFWMDSMVSPVEVSPLEVTGGRGAAVFLFPAPRRR